MSNFKVGDKVKVLTTIYEDLIGVVDFVYLKESGWDDEGDVAVLFYLGKDEYKRHPLLENELELVP